MKPLRRLAAARLSPLAPLIALVVVTAASQLWLGCGVKNAPKPPEQVRPQRIVDLRALSAADGVQLSWRRPEHYSGGGTMRDLAGFVIMRAEGDQDFKPLVNLPLTDRERFQRQRRISYVDADTRIGRYYRYQVISITDDGYQSRPSNEVDLTRVQPAPTPNPENFALPTPTMVP